MNLVKISFSIIFAFFALLITNPIVAEDSNEDANQEEEAFQLLDKDKDGLICREEWEAVDEDKDNTICKDEWKRWEFKSENKSKGLTRKFDIKWYDNNGDGFMSQEEYHRYSRGGFGGKP